MTKMISKVPRCSHHFYILHGTRKRYAVMQCSYPGICIDLLKENVTFLLLYLDIYTSSLKKERTQSS